MTPENDAALIDVLDRLRNRFFGKYRGVVTEVDALRRQRHRVCVHAGN